MKLDILKFSDEYNRAKMMTLHPLLEELKKIVISHREEFNNAYLVFRISILSFDKSTYDKVVSALKIDVSEEINVPGKIIKAEDICYTVSMQINLSVADYFEKEAKKIL